jgi:ABC-type Fe3+ transport system permease subunit
MTAPAITPGAIPVAERRVSGGLWSDATRRLLRNKPAVFGLACIMLFVFVALFAPVIAPYGPLERAGKSLEPPSPQFIMGTDLQGRDQYSRILYGAQISLQVGVVAVIMALFFGVIIGAAAGGLGGKVDAVLMRSTVVLLSIPGILLAIGIVAWLDRGLWQLMLAIALGLIVGKPVGFITACALAVRLGIAEKPQAYSWRQLAGAGAIAGIGFTMSLFIAGEAFQTPSDFAAAKIAVFAASILSAVIGTAILWNAKNEGAKS